ncbi:MAG: ssDNA-binding protein [Pseudomonadota bacterium]
MGIMDEDYVAVIDGARLMNENIYKRYRDKKTGKDGKYGAVVLLEKGKHDSLIESLRADIETVRKAELDKPVAVANLCLRDGDQSGKDPAAGCWELSANSDNQPYLFDKDTPSKRLTSDDPHQCYRGCRVRVKVRFWAQDNEWGKRINAELIGIQFRGDDEAFTSAAPMSADEAAKGFEASEAGDFGF